MPTDFIRESILQRILERVPLFPHNGMICTKDLNSFRAEAVKNMLLSDEKEFSVLEQKVVEAMQSQEVVAENINSNFENRLTLGQRVADRISTFGGSWAFILSFLGLLTLWIVVNAYLLAGNPFDPYPYILLNLILSCVAALQAPVIMMSQNRLETRDRLRNESDYMINLKAELEIRQLHMKIDLLLKHQWQRMLEIQQIQFELIESLHNIKK